MLYQIQNLKCAYNQGNTVLSIPDLEIESGQVLVVLGKSGFGKSTLLETLALMNNTIYDGKVIFSPPSMEKKTYEFRELWESNNSELIGKIRAKCFGFIFQQTNLMPNFSVYENIYITKMIQGYPEDDCKEEAAKLLERLGLANIKPERNVTTLSGGQRQRVAFARAVISTNDILFGDEPTGNLDEVNARDLLNFLADYIHNPDDVFQKTAIIVSHNIELAVSYADAILVITQDKTNNQGWIKPNGFFKRTQGELGEFWSNGSNSFKANVFADELKSMFIQ